jgi:hypothetical protein
MTIAPEISESSQLDSLQLAASSALASERAA